MARVVDCSFQRFSCGHDLFSATYTRSNRTKGTKIMRCFPHCCPEHMPRCYCGCSLHVLVTFDDLRAVDLDDVIVCARFETSQEQEPRHVVRLGAALTIPRVLLSRNSDDANATTWIVAEKESEVKQREVAKNSVLFVMNNHRFPRWYYGYESGATKNQRDMRHHLTAYVLVRSRTPSAEPESQRVVVIGRLPSPAFKLVSYRRARGEVKKPKVALRDDPLAALEEASSSTDDDGEISGSAHGTPTKTPPPRTATAATATQDASGFSSGTESPASTRSTETRVADVPIPVPSSLAKDLARRRALSSPFVMPTGDAASPLRIATRDTGVRQRLHELTFSTPEKRADETKRASRSVVSPSSPTAASRKRKAVSPAAKSLWWRQRPDDAQRVLHLHVLFVLLNGLALRDVMFCLRTKSDRLRKKWFVAISDAAAPSQDGIHRLAELARAFCLSVFSEDTSSTTTDGTPFEHDASREVIATCVEVMLEVGTSAAVKQLLDATWDAHKSHMLESHEIRELFVQFVRRLHGAIDTTLRNRRKDSTSAASGKPPMRGGGVAALVDDAMTAAFREPRLVTVRHDLVMALSDSTRAAERWYEVFVAQLRVAWVQHHERKASGISLLWQAALNTRRPIWTGKWVLDARSYRVRRPGGWFHRQPSSSSHSRDRDDAAAPLGSAVSWMVLLRQWLAVELVMDGSVLTLSSLLTGTTRASMRLVLDERQRVFKCFPDGQASAIGLGGGDRGAWLHGDYVGRGRDDGHELLCESYSIRQRAGADTELLRIAIKASIWEPTAPTRRCVVTAQLASATCTTFSAAQIATWPVGARHEQLYARAQWSVVADVDATYMDLR